MSQVNVVVNETTENIVVTISEQGIDGVGIPAGGTIGQVLVKQSGEDYDTTWAAGGGGGGTSIWGGIGGTLSNQTDLQNALNAKASTTHTHTKSQITDFSHVHPISEITSLQTSLDSKAASVHSHIISDTTGLQAALDLKASTTHTHTKSQITDFAHTHDDRYYTESETDTLLSGKSNTNHTHTKSQITDFAHTHVKADITDFSHQHPISDVTSLQSSLDGKQATLVSGTNIKTINGTTILGSGNLVIEGGGGGSTSWGAIGGTLSAQTDLQAALDSKSATTHLHDDRYYTETETDALLATKAATTHTHTKSQITDFAHTHVKADITDFAHNHDDRYYTESETDTLLSGKSNTSHTHVKADITDFAHNHDERYYTESETDTLLAAKAATSHTHTKSQITDFAHTHVKADITDFAHVHSISEVTSLQTSLDAKAADSLVVKLAGTQTITGEKTFSALTTIDAALRQRVPANRQTASYTLVIGDEGKLVETNVASANNLTVPPNSSVAFPVGTQILVSQYGAGQTTIVAGSGVTLRSSGTKLKLSAQYAMATLIKIATDEWMLSGDLSA
jgi:hypothetical protein